MFEKVPPKRCGFGRGGAHACVDGWGASRADEKPNKGDILPVCRMGRENGGRPLFASRAYAYSESDSALLLQEFLELPVLRHAFENMHQRLGIACVDHHGLH